MKKLFVLIAMAMIVYACGNQDTSKGAGGDSSAAKSDNTAPAAATAASPTDNPDYQKGLELIAKSDCLTCHKVEEKLVGPAYRDVANKYTSDDQTVTMLANKVIKGGSGVWGQIPMTAHPALSLDDAKQMVKYVLLLRNK